MQDVSGTIPNQIRIDNYIREHPTCELPGTIPLILQGERHDLSTYRLPLELLYFNIHNGRFAAEYKELVEKEGEDLDSTKEKDAKKKSQKEQQKKEKIRAQEKQKRREESEKPKSKASKSAADSDEDDEEMLLRLAASQAKGKAK